MGGLTFDFERISCEIALRDRSMAWSTYRRRRRLKLTCVYLVNALGYDLLFQDADL